MHMSRMILVLMIRNEYVEFEGYQRFQTMRNDEWVGWGLGADAMDRGVYVVAVAEGDCGTLGWRKMCSERKTQTFSFHGLLPSKKKWREVEVDEVRMWENESSFNNSIVNKVRHKSLVVEVQEERAKVWGKLYSKANDGEKNSWKLIELRIHRMKFRAVIFSSMGKHFHHIFYILCMCMYLFCYLTHSCDESEKIKSQKNSEAEGDWVCLRKSWNRVGKF